MVQAPVGFQCPSCVAEGASRVPPMRTALGGVARRQPRRATQVLIAANLVPLVGTVYFGWQLSNVMVLYWAESAVIGLFNVLKIVRIAGWPGLFAALFFLGHFGGFMAVHFLFIYGIFVEGFNSAGPGDDLSEVAALFVSLWPALAALFVSHAYSFFANFIGRREYRNRTVSDQMSEPYARIVFMHLILIFGGFLVLVLAFFGSKLVLELVLHRG